MAEFATEITDSRIIRKFMTQDEYELSKRNLKINARGFKENVLLTRYIGEIENWRKKNQITIV